MRYLMFLLGLMFANVANALDCDVAPTCAELGYSQDDDPYCADNGYMYCPLDHSYKKCVNMDCDKMGFTEDDKTSWCAKLIKCKGNPLMTLCQNLCEIGDVYYSDGTCGYAKDYDGTKIPVGVVFYVTDNGRHGKVVNLRDLKTDENFNFNPAQPYEGTNDVPWGLKSTIFEKNVRWPTTEETTLALQKRDNGLYNGQENTKIILAAKAAYQSCKDGSYKENTADYNKYCRATAALATSLFYPPEVSLDDALIGQGKWYLPALGELMDMYGYDNAGIESYSGATGATREIRSILDITFSTLANKGLNAKALSTSDYHSSSIPENSSSWLLNYAQGYRTTTFREQAKHVRACLKF